MLARVAGSNEPVVVMSPHGAGRLIVSGALDTWRYRADHESAFDRFWRSAISGVALATPPAVDVEITPAVARPGESVRVAARVHRSALDAGATASLQVSARLESGEAVRLWPDAEADVFAAVIRGRLARPAEGHRLSWRGRSRGHDGISSDGVRSVRTSNGAPCSAVVALRPRAAASTSHQIVWPTWRPTCAAKSAPRRCVRPPTRCDRGGGSCRLRPVSPANGGCGGARVFADAPCKPIEPGECSAPIAVAVRGPW